MNSRDIINLLNKGVTIARNNSPYETGNLKFNAIKKRRVNKGGLVRIDGRDAYYAQFLQEGRGYSDIHQGFVDLIRSEIEAMIIDYFTNTTRGRSRYKLRNADQQNNKSLAREASLQRSRTRFDKDVDIK